MPFNILVLTCLCHGTSLSENGVKIRFKPDKENERCLFFEIDDQSNPLSKFREEFDHEGPLCDLIIFYSAYERSQHLKVICFAELKGNDIEHALKQIKETYNSFIRKNNIFCRDKIIFKGCIRANSSAPSKTKRRCKEELRKIFKNHGDILPNEDIRDFLIKH